VAHKLERIAYRATNVSERVIVLVTGRIVEVNVSTYQGRIQKAEMLRVPFWILVNTLPLTPFQGD
jgi:hypothetical protein